MGREVKRVAVDFEWKLNQVWEGYINPHYKARKCTHCDGSGQSPQAKFLYDQWYGNAAFEPRSTGSELLTIHTPAIRAFAERNVKSAPSFYGLGEIAILRESNRLAEMWNKMWMHHLDQNDVNDLWAKNRLWEFNLNWREVKNSELPSPSAKDVNEWSLTGFGHDGINAWVCVNAKCERLGYPSQCSHCLGEGEIWDSLEDKAIYDAWKDYEPPAGDGYQLWENVSEGSPISPVFATKDAFINYLIEQGYSEGAAKSFADVGYAPSLMITNGRMYKDIESLNALDEED